MMGVLGLLAFFYCVFVLFLYCCLCIRSFLFLYALYGHLVSDVCYKTAIVEEFNQE
jgi:hypothetical protein